ncbi:hypothetical protein BGY98DRAFT_962446 [Russula aff. rugulosa BPL654]|nr:hypothetical protein BGY98DRAFT_962446 [Russula aff. rugulosa BPL654]
MLAPTHYTISNHRQPQSPPVPKTTDKKHPPKSSFSDCCICTHLPLCFHQCCDR